MYAKLFARDAAIVAAAALLFNFVGGFSGGSGPLADLAGVVAGAALGLMAFPLHEWGHFLGAVATRSRIEPAASLHAFFSFSFDSRSNSLRQFFAMSFGGWLGTALSVALAYGALPDALLASRVARGLVLASVLLVALTEIPLIVRALATGRIPPIETVRRPAEGARAAA
jgi:hypothetical protein